MNLYKTIAALAASSLLTIIGSPNLAEESQKVETKTSNSIFAITAKTIDGQASELSEHKGKVILIVNTASKCGYTRQYGGLQNLYSTFKDRGFIVLGFPCNQFGAQEPGSSEEIKNFCTKNFGVDFPIFEKVEVNGPNAHPLFKMLKAEAPGALKTEAIKWNFTKFLVDRNGRIVKRFAPGANPDELAPEIEKLL